eukprot:1161347-Pelagomonas_calceolata.AAC.13
MSDAVCVSLQRLGPNSAQGFVSNKVAAPVDICSQVWFSLLKGTLLLQPSCPCRQVQLCNPILSYPSSSPSASTSSNSSASPSFTYSAGVLSTNTR